MKGAFAKAILLTFLLVFIAACSDSEKAVPTPQTQSPSPSSSSTSSRSSSSLIDDEPAHDALLLESQLPAGSWSSADLSLFGWSSFSPEDLAAIPECAAIAPNAQTLQEPRSGNAAQTWVRSDGAVQLDSQVELYLGPPPAAEVHAVRTSVQVASCFKAAVQPRLGKVEVRSFDVGVSTDELRVTEVAGVDISTTFDRDGQQVPVVLRVVSVRAGGGLTTIILTSTAAGDPAQALAAIDLAPVVRAAAQDLLDIFGG